MKICYVARDDIFSKRGGDTVLCELYMQMAQSAGCDVTTWTSSSSLVEADLYHAFNIDRPLEIFPRLRVAVDEGRRFVITALHHPNKWMEKFRTNARGMSKTSKMFYASHLGNTTRRAETIKELVRQVIGQTIEPSTLMHSWKYRVQWILKNASVVLLQSRCEASYIVEDYGVMVPKDIFFTLPNPAMCNTVQVAPKTAPGYWDALFVGRVEVRKNALSLALAAIEAKKRVLFIGNPNPNEPSYAAQFFSVVENNNQYLHWIKGVSRENLQGYYRQAGMLVNPSYVEVSPIVDIEALANNCPLVTTKYALHHEFLPDKVVKCDPYSIESIAKCLTMEHQYPGVACIPSERDVAESLMGICRRLFQT